MYASTPTGEALLLAYQDNPFRWAFQQPDTDIGADMSNGYATGGLAGAPLPAALPGVPMPSGQIDPQTLAMLQQLVAAGKLPASVLANAQPGASPAPVQQQPSPMPSGGEQNGMQQSANNGPGVPSLGLSPGRTSLMSGIGRVVGLVNPMAGAVVSAVNDAQGAIAGDQQMAAMSGVTGRPDTLGNQLGAALSGATGSGMFSNYSRGLGGYGQPGVGGLTGMRDAMDPGVDGAARAMGADAANAVARASMNQTTQNPAGYAAAVHDSMSGDMANPGHDNGPVGGEDGGAGFAIGGVIRSTGGNYFARKMARGSGLVKAITPGRADAIHTNVPRGGYVVPADVVSGMGQGNTIAGGRRIAGMLHRVGSFKNGGQVESVPVRLSGGEFYIHPNHLAAIGRGNPQQGAAIMDHVVSQVRAHVAQHAMQAPPPR